MTALNHNHISISTDGAEAVIRQKVDWDTEVEIRITRDQAIQVADFLLKSFKTKKAQSLGSEAGFDAWWDAYPAKRRVDKSGCLFKWRSRNLHTKAAQIIAATESAKTSEDWTKEGGKYIPMSSTYLNQSRWESAQEDQLRVDL